MLNGKRRQLGPYSIRELRGEIHKLQALQKELGQTRNAIFGLETECRC